MLCAANLDSKRLGKQRVEGLQIRRALANKYNGAWQNHPAVLMWRGYEKHLDNYILHCCMAWRDRGYVDNVEPALRDEFDAGYSFDLDIPPFVTERLVISHRGNLYMKDPIHYKSFAMDALELESVACCPQCNYYWPTHDLKNFQKGGPYGLTPDPTGRTL